jgi:hypothetical protein
VLVVVQRKMGDSAHNCEPVRFRRIRGDNRCPIVTCPQAQ